MAKDSKIWENPLEKIFKPYRDIQAVIKRTNQLYKNIHIELREVGGIGKVGSLLAQKQQDFSMPALTTPAVVGGLPVASRLAKPLYLYLPPQLFAGSAFRESTEPFIKPRILIDGVMNRSFTDSLFSGISSVIGLQSLADQQALNMLNAAGSIGSVAASIALTNRPFADSLTRSFSTSAIVGLQSFVNQRPLNMLEVTELLRPVIKLSQSTISADLFAGSVVKSLSMSSLTMPTIHLRIPTAIESPQSIFKSYQPIFAKQEEWKDSLFSPVQRQTTQTERIFYKALTNDTDLESNFIPLKSNEYRKDLFTPESPSRQPQLLVPQAVESSDDACFDPVFWNILTQVEQYLRSTIEKCLTELSGSRWIKQRVPCDMRRRWEQRQEEERSAGRPIYNLIQYADFMDLVSIIIRSDNWKDVFKSIFKNKNEIQISLERLHPIRKSIAHSRPLTKFDILTLANEASRIFRALGLSFSLELSIIRFHLR